MNIKEQWFNSFEERLWKHHTCDWDLGNRNPHYPYQIACAYFDWGDDGLPACSVDESFNRYLENQND